MRTTAFLFSLLSIASSGFGFPTPAPASYGETYAPRPFSELHHRPAKNANQKMRYEKRQLESSAPPHAAQVSFNIEGEVKKSVKKSLREEEYSPLAELSKEIELLDRLEEAEMTLSQMNSLIVSANDNFETSLISIRHASNRARSSPASRANPEFHLQIIRNIQDYRLELNNMAAYYVVGQDILATPQDREQFVLLVEAGKISRSLIATDLADIVRIIPILQFQLAPVLNEIKRSSDKIASGPTALDLLLFKLPPRSKDHYYFV